MDELPYYDVYCIRHLIDNIQYDGSYESAVRNAWSNICHKLFPHRENFVVKNETKEGRVVPDLVVVHVRDFFGGPAEIPFLVIECKRKSGLLRPLTFHDFDDVRISQLDDQIKEEDIHSCVYGAVAIGTLVRFYHARRGYEINHNRVSAAPLPFNDQILDIINDGPKVEDIVQYMKEHAPVTQT